MPVVNGYIADLHGNEEIPGLSACTKAPDALGSGSACYIEQAQYYNQAFGSFFKRLAADGIMPRNTLFIFSSDEGDHEAGANAGRAIQPTPANCDGATVSGDTVTPDVECSYPAGSFGELDANVTGLLATQQHNTVPFSLEADTAPEFYVTGDPGPDASPVRTLEHDVANITAANPYTGTTQKIDNYIADPAEEAILHMVNADPARTPTFAMFAKPDYYLDSGPATCSGSCVQQDTGYAWDHGDYAAEINTNYAGFVGPGVRHLGLDGPTASQGPSSAGAGQRADHRVRTAPARALGGRDGHPADADVPDRAARRLRARRPGDHPDPGPPEPGTPRPGGDRPGGVLQAAQLQRGPVRRGHPDRLDQGGGQRQPR